MKKILIICLAVMFIMPVRANAFSWQDFLNWLFSTSETTTTVDTTKIYSDITAKLSNIKSQANSLESSVKTSFVNVVSAFSTQNEIKALEEKLNAKDADLFQIISDYKTTLNSDKARILLTLKTMSETEKTSLAKEVNNLSALAQKYNTYSSDASALKSSLISQVASSSERTEKIKEINETFSDLNKKSSSVSAFANIIKIYAKLTGLSI